MARPSISVGTSSIFEPLVPKQLDCISITTHGLDIDNRKKSTERESMGVGWDILIFSNYADHVETFSGELLTSRRLAFMNQARLSQQNSKKWRPWSWLFRT